MAEQSEMRQVQSERRSNGRKTAREGGDQGVVRDRYKVRQVTSYQASWTETARGEEGTFTLQLILDHGVDEYVLDVDSDDLEVMLRLLKSSDHTTFDLERKVLMFANINVE